MLELPDLRDSNKLCGVQIGIVEVVYLNDFIIFLGVRYCTNFRYFAVSDLSASPVCTLRVWHCVCECTVGNIFTDVPIISRWLKELLVLPFMISNNKKLTIGNYTYLDGELHVRLSIACNAIITHLCNDNDYTKVAFLCTPTDCHVIPKAAYEAAKENYNNRTLFQSLFGGLLGEWWWCCSCNPCRSCLTGHLLFFCSQD